MIKALIRISCILIAISCLLYSCNLITEELVSDDFDYVNRQLTPNKKFYIYKYSKWGPMAWSLETTGTLLLRKDEKFALDAGEVIEGEIASWLSTDTLLVYEYEKGIDPVDSLPLDVTFKNYDGLVIRTEKYRPGGGGAGYFTCDSVEFGNLSITLHGINDEIKTVKYPLGAVTLTTSLGMITEIHVEWYSKAKSNTNYKFSGTMESHRYTYTLTKKLEAKLFDRPGIYQDYLWQMPSKKQD